MIGSLLEAPALSVCLYVLGWAPYTQVTTVTFFNFPSVMEVAFILTLGLTDVLVFYTLQSKRDFSSWKTKTQLTSCGICLSLLTSEYLETVPVVHLGLCFAGFAFFCVYIIVNTHQLMCNLHPVLHVLAAINLFISVICLYPCMVIFLMLIKLIW